MLLNHHPQNSHNSSSVAGLNVALRNLNDRTKCYHSVAIESNSMQKSLRMKNTNEDLIDLSRE